MIKFSLILPTLNRSQEIQMCLESIIRQKYKMFEVIIIDQSEDKLTKKIIKKYKSEKNIDIFYYKVSFKGLSKARNYGIRKCSGEYIALLDDDAIYECDYLKNATDLINKNGDKYMYSGIIYTIGLNKNFVNYDIAFDNEILSLNKILKISLSAGLIFCNRCIKDCGEFDELFGIGAQFGAAEETDFLLRCLNKKYNVIHSKKMVLFHPESRMDYSTSCITKAYNYALGDGALIKKHMYYKHNFKLFYKTLKFLVSPIVKFSLNITNKNKRIYYKKILIGRILGFMRYRRVNEEI